VRFEKRTKRKEKKTKRELEDEEIRRT